jgi:glutamate racemase
MGGFFMAKTIGIFDSGVGGLTILSSIVKEMSDSVEYHYVADSLHAPYGSKSIEALLERSRRITEFLISKGSDLIVVACNTATTQVISSLRAEFNIPFVGIEPAVKPAAQLSVSKRIGVIATANTLKSGLFKQTLETYASDCETFTRIGEGLVEAIETGELASVELNELVRDHVAYFNSNEIDVLVLGCTHYSFVSLLFKKYLDQRTSLVTPNEAVARRVQSVLGNLNRQPESVRSIYVYSTSEKLLSLKKLIAAENLQVDQVLQVQI